MSSTGHNTATIPLPPGFTLEQFQDLQGKIVTIAIALACAVALVCWDYLNLLPAEITLYKTLDSHGWRSPGTYAFIILRYSGLFALIPGLFFTSLQNQHCQASASLGETGVVLVTGSAGFIFCYRVFSIWNFNKMVVAPVSALYLIMIGCWIAVATQLHATEGPHTPFGSNCKLGAVPAWSPIGFASSVAFDTVILVLTVTKLNGSFTKSSSVSRQLLRDSIFYFVIVSVANVVVLVIQSLGDKYEFVKPLALPYPTLIMTAIGSRVFLNLRLYDHRRQMPSEGIPLSSQDIQFANQSSSGYRRPYKGVMILDSTVTNTTTLNGTGIDTKDDRSSIPDYVVKGGSV